jgi:hypothetical protein
MPTVHGLLPPAKRNINKTNKTIKRCIRSSSMTSSPPMMTRSTNSYQPRASVLWMDQQLRKRRERLATQLSQQSCIDSRTTPEWTTSVPYLPEGLDQGMKSYVLSPRNQRLWQSSSLHNLSRSTRGTHPSVGLSSQNHTQSSGQGQGCHDAEQFRSIQRAASATLQSSRNQ